MGVRQVAFHEAGHAVAAYAVGRHFQHLTIIPNDDSLGHCSFSRWKSFRPDVSNDHKTIGRIETVITTALAGFIAEFFLTGRKNHAGSQHDIQFANEMACHAVGSVEELRAYLELIRIRTAHIFTVPRNWIATTMLAETLLKEKTVTYSKAKSLILDAQSVTANCGFRGCSGHALVFDPKQRMLVCSDHDSNVTG